MFKVIFFILSILIILIVYRLFVGPSRLEREVLKQGGLHPCYYCKKTINIHEDKCEHCKKPNYKSIRKGRIKYFLIMVGMYIFALAKLYRFLFPQ